MQAASDIRNDCVVWQFQSVADVTEWQCRQMTGGRCSGSVRRKWRPLASGTLGASTVANTRRGIKRDHWPDRRTKGLVLIDMCIYTVLPAFSVDLINFCSTEPRSLEVRLGEKPSYA